MPSADHQKRLQTAIDIFGHWLTVCALKREFLMIYAQHKVSRTPDAEQRSQTTSESQRQIAIAHAGKNTDASAPGKREDAGKALRDVTSPFDKVAPGFRHRAVWYQRVPGRLYPIEAVSVQRRIHCNTPTSDHRWLQWRQSRNKTPPDNVESGLGHAYWCVSPLGDPPRSRARLSRLFANTVRSSRIAQMS